MPKLRRPASTRSVCVCVAALCSSVTFDLPVARGQLNGKKKSKQRSEKRCCQKVNTLNCASGCVGSQRRVCVCVRRQETSADADRRRLTHLSEVSDCTSYPTPGYANRTCYISRSAALCLGPAAPHQSAPSSCPRPPHAHTKRPSARRVKAPGRSLRSCVTVQHIVRRPAGGGTTAFTHTEQRATSSPQRASMAAVIDRQRPSSPLNRVR